MINERKIFAAVALLSAALTAYAQTPSSGWEKRGSSLLLYDSSGTLTLEIGLGPGYEAEGGLPQGGQQTFSGVSPDRRFAWTLKKRIVTPATRTARAQTRRKLTVYNLNGAPLWEENKTDMPERGQPIIFAADAQMLVVAMHDASGWKMSVRSDLGNEIDALGPFPRLEEIALTANGRYALASWRVPDTSATTTLLEIPTKRRHDIASGDLLLGAARLAEDGKVYSGSKLVFDFAASSSTTVSRP